MESPVKAGMVQRLVDEHYASLYRYAYRLTGNTGDAEDLTQETFCKAQLKQDQLRDQAHGRAWLFSILRNAYLHRVRSDRYRRWVSLESLGELTEPLPDPLPPIDPAQLQQALQELPEVFRTPLILYYLEEFSYRDIADQMELPLGTVMSRLARAKAFLRNRLLGETASVVADGTRRDIHGL